MLPRYLYWCTATQRATLKYGVSLGSQSQHVTKAALFDKGTWNNELFKKNQQKHPFQPENEGAGAIVHLVYVLRTLLFSFSIRETRAVFQGGTVAPLHSASLAHLLHRNMLHDVMLPHVCFSQLQGDNHLIRWRESAGYATDRRITFSCNFCAVRSSNHPPVTTKRREAGIKPKLNLNHRHGMLTRSNEHYV